MSLRACLFLVTFFSITIAHGAEFSSTQTQDGKIIIVLNGSIADGDVTKFKSIIQTANTGGKAVYAIRLNSPGGSLVEGVQLAEIIKYAKMATSVPAGSSCASACFVAFAAGIEKFVSYSGSVGVHGASDSSGRETTQSSAATVSMARIVKELGVPAGIIGKMVVTPPHQVVWLSPDDLRSMGTKMQGKPEQVPTDQQQAGLPTQLAPSVRAATAPAAAPKKWDVFVRDAFEISAQQNGGRARTGRTCQPEMKVCITAVFFKGKDGTEVMAKSTENLAGKAIKNEVCTFNDFQDVRTCLNWEDNSIHRDMKNSQGEWIKVGDE